MASHLTITAEDHSGPAPKIHSACDECRARKLRCSSTFPRCSRCDREGITCVYSPMKTMGRPRKKRKADGEPADSMATGDIVERGTGLTEMSTATVDQPWTIHDSASMFDHDGILEFQLPDQLWADGNSPHINAPYTSEPTNSERSASLNSFGGSPHDPGRNTPSSQTPPSQSMASSVDPALSTGLAPAPPCPCLSTSYLTLNSLQTLPSYSFPFILSPLRQSIAAAYTILTCPICPQSGSSILLNVQLLNALLQAILERIVQALRAIDDEAKRLKETGETKPFRIGDSSPEAAHLHTGRWDCGAAFEVNLKGAEWRRLARKAIRTEVKGLQPTTPSHRTVSDSHTNGCLGGAPPQQHGSNSSHCGRPLKVPLLDIIQGMINRQDEWHNNETMNAFRVAMFGFSTAGKAAHPGQDHDCVKPLRRLIEVVDRFKLDDD